MDQSLLDSRAISGMYFSRLEADPGSAWLDGVANLFGSDQASETYNWLGQTPAMREWISGRLAKGFTGQGVTILNKHYEATLQIENKDRRRDKTGQLEARLGEFAERGQTHWASLLSTLIVNAAATVCYDGEYFFDTDHSEGSSGTQSNKITVDISALPAAVHGAVTMPSPEEMQQAMFGGITQILGLVDDRGEPMNEFARNFLVMVPLGLAPYAKAAVTSAGKEGQQVNMTPSVIDGVNISIAVNPRLTTAGWTDKFVIFRTDASTKALIRQTEKEIELKVKGDGSDFEFDNDAIQLGIDGWRGCGYGHWQRACHVTMV